MDLDFPSELQRLSTYFNLKRFGDVEVRKSSTGKGNHMIVRGIPITYEDSLRIRAMLGECPNRLRFDSEDNHKPKQILWCEKIVDGISHYVQPLTERNILALPLCSRPPQVIFKGRRMN